MNECDILESTSGNYEIIHFDRLCLFISDLPANLGRQTFKGHVSYIPAALTIGKNPDILCVLRMDSRYECGQKYPRNNAKQGIHTQKIRKAEVF